jgi:hypothetical protein
MKMIEEDDWSEEAIQHWDVHHWQNVSLPSDTTLSRGF